MDRTPLLESYWRSSSWSSLPPPSAAFGEEAAVQLLERCGWDATKASTGADLCWSSEGCSSAARRVVGMCRPRSDGSSRVSTHRFPQLELKRCNPEPGSEPMPPRPLEWSWQPGCRVLPSTFSRSQAEPCCTTSSDAKATFTRLSVS